MTAKQYLIWGVEYSLERFSSSKWIHCAIKERADELIGLDYLKEEVDVLQRNGFSIVYGDAECFDLERTFDVIVAGT